MLYRINFGSSWRDAAFDTAPLYKDPKTGEMLNPNGVREGDWMLPASIRAIDKNDRKYVWSREQFANKLDSNHEDYEPGLLVKIVNDRGYGMTGVVKPSIAKRVSDKGSDFKVLHVTPAGEPEAEVEEPQASVEETPEKETSIDFEPTKAEEPKAEEPFKLAPGRFQDFKGLRQYNSLTIPTFEAFCDEWDSKMNS
jgi:hypothetical protein